MTNATKEGRTAVKRGPALDGTFVGCCEQWPHDDPRLDYYRRKGATIYVEEDAYDRLAALREALVDALESIERYGLDTMSGPMEAPPDLSDWYRVGVREMVHRARTALSLARSKA